MTTAGTLALGGLTLVNPCTLTTSGSGNDVYTAKFRSADGTRVWTSWYSGPQYDDAWGIAVTGGGVRYTIGVANPVNG